MENGLKVGVIGFTTDFIPIWEKAYNLTNFDVLDTFSSIQKIHDELKPKVDVLIGIYHGGFEYDLETHEQLSTSSANIAYKICKELQFDLLLTGHQHVPLQDRDLFGAHIIQTPHNASKYAQVNITVADDQKLSIHSSLNAVSINPEPHLSPELMPLETRVQQWLDSPVGYLNVELQPAERIAMAVNGLWIA